MKPYLKLASTLVVLGGGLLLVERYGLSELRAPGRPAVHLGEPWLSLLFAAPLVLILAGCVVFVVGKMRRP